MSEYQYYEFLAVDRPLDEQQLAEVRGLSTRAVITPTSFVNEYHFGDFRGDPTQLVQHYYDAHLYLANWGTRRCMLRLPESALDPELAEQYCIDEHVVVWSSGEDLVLEVASEDDEVDFVEGPDASLAVIVGVRSELAAGDPRGLYLAWLAGVGSWERDEDALDPEDEHELEPPVPAGLGTLTGPQRALADFLRLDDDLLEVAAQASPDSARVTDDPDALASWVSSLDATEKDQLLTRVMRDESASVRMRLLRRFREHSDGPGIEQSRRTVADLLDTAAQRRSTRGRRAAAQQAE